MRVFAELVLLYTAITINLREDIREDLPEVASDISLQALQLLIFQSSEAFLSDAQGWINTLFRILGLVQAAMLVFAFRARIKRS